MYQTIIIYHLGSIGDTVVALPAFHLIARRYAQARRVLLTNLPGERESASFALVGGTGLADDCIDYRLGERNPAVLWRLRRRIGALGPAQLIYLTRPRGRAKALRDYWFFRACGVSRIVGAPLARSDQEWMLDASGSSLESETQRLGRCIRELGDLRLDDAASWDLRLTSTEHRTASAALQPLAGRPVVAIGAGVKIAAKDWGETNWREFAAGLSGALPGAALAFIGGREDVPRADAIAAAWGGPFRNLCGRLSPRESAAALAQARCFVGHDGGPMHLAASVGTPCVALFGGHNAPGIWYPCGRGHTILHEAAMSRIAASRIVEATVATFGGNARVRFGPASQ